MPQTTTATQHAVRPIWRTGVDQRWELPVPRVKVSVRALRYISGLTVPRPSPRRDRAQVESGDGSASNALRMARARVGS